MGLWLAMTLLLLLALPYGGMAQGRRGKAAVVLHIEGTTQTTLQSLPKRQRPKPAYADSAAAHDASLYLVEALRAKGHAAASLDTFEFRRYPDVDSFIAFIYSGPWVGWGSGNDVAAAIGSPPTKKGDMLPRPGIAFDASAWQTAVRGHLENQAGRGFATASLALPDTYTLRNDSLLLGLPTTEGGPAFAWDSLRIVGAAPVQQAMLEELVGFRRGTPFTPRSARRLARALAALPYVTVLAPPRVVLRGTSAVMVATIVPRKASSFSGLVGFFPNSQGKGLSLNGDLSLALHNGLKQGESIAFSYRSLQAQTQDIRLQASLPVVGRLPIGPEASLALYRRDTTLLDVSSRLGITYSAGGAGRVGAFVQRRLVQGFGPSRATPTSPVVQTLQSTRTTLYGLQGTTVSPLGGIGTLALSGSVATGTRRAPTEGASPTTPSTPTNPSAWQAELVADAVLPLFQNGRSQALRRFSLAPQIQARGLWAKQLLGAEALRLGGLRSLRGFEEEALQATTYALALVELRFATEPDAYVYAFGNGARVLNTTQAAKDGRVLAASWPYGVGVGYAFGAAGGTFALAYPVGGGAGQAAQLRTAKLHFGYRARL